MFFFKNKKNYTVDTIDVILVIIIFILFIYLLSCILEMIYFKENFNENSNASAILNQNKNDIPQISASDMVVNQQKEILSLKRKKFAIMPKEILAPNNVYIKSKINGIDYFIGYVDATKCISKLPKNDEHIDCSKYSIVLETLEGGKTRKNIGFNITKISDYDYNINPSFNYNVSKFNISSSLFNKHQFTNICGDTDATTNDVTINFLQLTAGSETEPIKYHICFFINKYVYYLTFAHESVEQCNYYYNENNVTKHIPLQKVALTNNVAYALDFIIVKTI